MHFVCVYFITFIVMAETQCQLRWHFLCGIKARVRTPHDPYTWLEIKWRPEWGGIIVH